VAVGGGKKGRGAAQEAGVAVKFGRSSAAFGAIQAARDAGPKVEKRGGGKGGKSSSALKL
jgi:hypothetical protein